MGDKSDSPKGFRASHFSTPANSLASVGVMVDSHDPVQCFTPEDQLLMGITVEGREPGQLVRPHGMAVDRHG